MDVVAATVSYPPHRFIGSELMTHRMLSALQARGHSVTSVTRRGLSSGWEGIASRGGALPAGDVLIYHPDWVELVDGWTGPKVAICHNARMGVQLGIYNTEPDLVTVNSETMRSVLGGIVVHPPVVVPRTQVSGDRVTIVGLEQSNKVGPFWDIVARLPEYRFLAVKNGYGEQHIPESLPPNVEVVDHTSAMEPVWARTRMLLVPSDTESWSMAGSEAMAHGIPVIAAPLPGVQENLGAAGSWAQRDDVDQWVAAIRSVEGRWDALSSLARARAVEQAAQHSSELEAWCEAVEELCRR